MKAENECQIASGGGGASMKFALTLGTTNAKASPEVTLNIAEFPRLTKIPNPSVQVYTVH